LQIEKKQPLILGAKIIIASENQNKEIELKTLKTDTKSFCLSWSTGRCMKLNLATKSKVIVLVVMTLLQGK
jgi:hypothetical protein